MERVQLHSAVSSSVVACGKSNADSSSAGNKKPPPPSSYSRTPLVVGGILRRRPPAMPRGAFAKRSGGNARKNCCCCTVNIKEEGRKESHINFSSQNCSITLLSVHSRIPPWGIKWEVIKDRLRRRLPHSALRTCGDNSFFFSVTEGGREGGREGRLSTVGESNLGERRRTGGDERWQKVVKKAAREEKKRSRRCRLEPQAVQGERRAARGDTEKFPFL